MTKTTSYEISKELKEIGFKAESEKVWAGDNAVFQDDLYQLKNKKDLHKFDKFNYYAALDLETILDALPKHIEFKGPRRYAQESAYLALEFSKSSPPEVDYIYDDYDHTPVYNLIHIEGESLADTAARLLITLIKDKIVKL